MSDHVPATTPTILDWVKNPDDREAWQKFALRYAHLIEGWCRKHGLSREDAEDLTQEILLKMVHKIAKYDNERGHFRNWLSTLTYNESMSALRKRSKRSFQTLAEDKIASDDLAQNCDTQAETEVLHVATREAKAAVNANHWQCFDDMVFKDRTARELATELGMTVAAVHMAKHRVQQLVIAKVRELGSAKDLELHQ